MTDTKTDEKKLISIEFDKSLFTLKSAARFLNEKGFTVAAGMLVEKGSQILYRADNPPEGAELHKEEIYADMIATYACMPLGACAPEMQLQTVDLRGVEICQCGQWEASTGKFNATEEMFDSIVASYDALKDVHKIPVKLGHDDDQKMLQQDGYPAAGWIENVRKIGTKLVADIVGVPRMIAELIRNMAYRGRSVEIYHGWKDGATGKTYDHVLGGLALLGEDLPAVSGLSDIISMYKLGDNGKRSFSFASKSICTISKSETKTDESKTPIGGVLMDEKEIKKLIEDKAVLDAELTAAKKTSAASEEEIQKLKDQIKMLQDKLAEMENASKASAEKLSAFEAKEAEMVKAALDAEVTELKKAMDKKVPPAMQDAVVKSFASMEPKDRKDTIDFYAKQDVNPLFKTQATDSNPEGKTVASEDEGDKKVIAYCAANGLDHTKASDYKRAAVAVLTYEQPEAKE